MSAISAYEAGLTGQARCFWQVEGSRRLPLPISRYTGPVTPDDELVLGPATPPPGGAVIDIGCGPGRLAAELRRRGIPTLGIDVSGVAVRMARDSGVEALHCSIFDPLPGEGTWSRAVLADGNIGIGGDPGALMARVAEVLAPGGRLVTDLTPDASGIEIMTANVLARCSAGEHIGGPLAWAVVGADAAEELGAGAGLTLVDLVPREFHTVAVWQR